MQFFYPVIFGFAPSCGLYVSSFVTRSTLSLFALVVTWPLCFLRVRYSIFTTTKFVLNLLKDLWFWCTHFRPPSLSFNVFYDTSKVNQVACDLLSPFCGMLSLCGRRKCPYARVVIPSSRMYLLLSKQERLHFVISQLFII